MEPQNWKSVGEFVGMGAIVASLIFVGFQLRQDREIALADSLAASEASYTAINALISDHAAVWSKGRNGEELTESEVVIMTRLVSALHRRARYTAAMRRNLGAPGTAALRDLARELYSNPGARRIWEAETEKELADWDRMSPENTFWRRDYRNEVLAELAKLDSVNH